MIGPGLGARVMVATRPVDFRIENCKLSGINPHDWLTRTLVALANGHQINRVVELMPWTAVL